VVRLSKYFTPVLGDEEKSVITRILGLNKLSFKLVERFGDQELLVQYWSPAGKSTRVSGGIADDSCGDSVQSPSREIITHHLSLIRDLKEEDSLGLLGRVVAYPYSEILRSDSSAIRLEFAPTDFSQNLQSLKQIVFDFEALMARYELCVLWIRSSEASFPLLFHFVRKKLIRVGTMSSLKVLAESFQTRQLKPSDLKQFFGTHAAFFELDLSLFNGFDSPLELLKMSIDRCLTTPESKVLGEPVYKFETAPYLDLEL